VRTLKSSCTGGAGEQADDTCESYSTVAILAQGTNWADAFTQAFLLRGLEPAGGGRRSDPGMASGIRWHGDMTKRLLARVATRRGAPVGIVAMPGRSRYATSRDVMLGITPSKIMEVTLMRPSHGNL